MLQNSQVSTSIQFESDITLNMVIVQAGRRPGPSLWKNKENKCGQQLDLAALQEIKANVMCGKLQEAWICLVFFSKMEYTKPGVVGQACKV